MLAGFTPPSTPSGCSAPMPAPRAAGGRLGATLAAKDRRRAELAVTLTGGPGGGARPGLLAAPDWGLLGAPALLGEASLGEVALTVAGAIAERDR